MGGRDERPPPAGPSAADAGTMTLTAQPEAVPRGTGQLAVDLDGVTKRFGEVTAVAASAADPTR